MKKKDVLKKLLSNKGPEGLFSALGLSKLPKIDPEAVRDTMVVLDKIGIRTHGGFCEWTIPHHNGGLSFGVRKNQKGYFILLIDYGLPQLFDDGFKLLERIAEVRPDLAYRFAEPMGDDK